MQLTEQQQQMQQLQRTLITKCWEDESFKNDLIAEPTSAIKKLTGAAINVPEGKKLVVVDQTNDSNLYFNIPAIPNLDDLDLTDEQLEMVAGGITPGSLILFGYFAAGATVGGLMGAGIGNMLGD